MVADRCTDETAAIARRFGASVLERGPEEAPGRAAARQAGLEHARALDWDAVVMLDADSVIAPGFFAACERALRPGVDAAQARSESARGRTLATEASLAAFALQGITLPRGRDRLGLSARLRGTGMVDPPRDWRSRIASAPPPPRISCSRSTCSSTGSGVGTSTSAAAALGGRQSLERLRGARRSATRPGGWPLRARTCRGCCAAPSRDRDPASLEAAWFLATPPFALAVALTARGAGGGGDRRRRGRRGLICSGGLLTLAAVIVLGLIQARAGLRTWLALLAAPWYLAWKALIQLRALASVLRRDDYYPPTARV